MHWEWGVRLFFYKSPGRHHKAEHSLFSFCILCQNLAPCRLLLHNWRYGSAILDWDRIFWVSACWGFVVSWVNMRFQLTLGSKWIKACTKDVEIDWIPMILQPHWQGNSFMGGTLPSPTACRFLSSGSAGAMHFRDRGESVSRGQPCLGGAKWHR